MVHNYDQLVQYYCITIHKQAQDHPSELLFLPCVLQYVIILPIVYALSYKSVLVNFKNFYSYLVCQIELCEMLRPQ